MFVFFLAYFKTGQLCKLEILWIQDSNLEILWIQDSNRCIITIKRNEKKKNLGWNCFRKNMLK